MMNCESVELNGPGVVIARAKPVAIQFMLGDVNIMHIMYWIPTPAARNDGFEKL